MDIKTLLIGNLTIDKNQLPQKTYISPGGSAYFMARFFEDMDADVVIVSPYGKDFNFEKIQKSKIFPTRACFEKNLIFQNIYKTPSERKQFVKYYKECGFKNIEKDIFRKSIRNQDIVIVAPILDNLEKDLVRKIVKNYKNSLKVLSPQGFYRKVNENGEIVSKNWENAFEIICLFDVVVVSEKEWVTIKKDAYIWSKNGPIVIVTRDLNGYSVYNNGKRKDERAIYISDVVDATGSGDIFAASFSYYLKKTNDLKQALYLANGISAMSLRLTSDQLKYSEESIKEFLKNVNQNGSYF